MSEWDKLWDKNKEQIHTSWHPEAHLDEWLAKVKAEGDKLQEKQRETQFLLNCESSMLRECRLQLGDYMNLQAKVDKIIALANTWANIQPSPYADAYADPPLINTVQQAHGWAIKKILELSEFGVHGGRVEDIEDEKLRNILLGLHTKKPEGGPHE